MNRRGGLYGGFVSASSTSSNFKSAANPTPAQNANNRQVRFNATISKCICNIHSNIARRWLTLERYHYEMLSLTIYYIPLEVTALYRKQNFFRYQGRFRLPSSTPSAKNSNSTDSSNCRINSSKMRSSSCNGTRSTGPV